MSRRPSRRQRHLDFEDLKSIRFRWYIRESTERQAGADHYGPANQRSVMRQFSERWEIALPDIEYFDTWTGRTVRGRTDLQRALEDAKAGQYGGLLFYHTSRSFRNKSEATLMKAEFRKAGVTLVFASQGIISNHPRYKLAEGMFELMDEQRSDEHGMMIFDTTRSTFERGGVNGKPPLGYRRYHGEPGDPHNGGLITDERGAAAVHCTYRLYLTKQHSYSTIVVALNQDGHRTRLGDLFSKGAVEEILRNRVYVGDTVWAPGTPEEEVKTGNHEPIISREDFAAVARIRQERSNGGGRHAVDRVYPLSGSLCDTCDATYSGSTGSRGEQRRYRHKVGSDCGGRKSFQAVDLEWQFGTFVQKRVALPDDYLPRLRRLFATIEDVDPDPHQQERGLVEREKRRLIEQYRLLTDEEMPLAEFQRQKASLDRRLRELGPHTAPTDFLNLKRAIEVVRNFGELWFHPGTTHERQKAFIQEVVDEVRVGVHGLCALRPRTEYRPLFALAEAESMGGIKSGWADSNRRPHGPKPRALPD